MASLASINIRFNADLAGFSSQMQNASRQIAAAGRQMQSIGQNLSLFVTGPIVLAGGAAIKFASDYNESLNKVDVAFKSSSNEVKAFAKNTLQTSGIAEGSALNMASNFGDMSTSMGLSTKEAAKMSTSLVTLGGDLSSFKNIGIEQSQTALTGVFTGETESLKRLGIVMTEVNLQTYAYSQGIKTKIQDMGQAEKVQLRYNYIMSVTKNAQGDFARTSGGAANQMRIFQESLKQLAQQFGAIILPAFTSIIKIVNDAITSFGGLSEGTKKTIVIVAGIVAAIGPLLLGLGALATLLPTLGAGFAIMTGPIGLVVAGVAAIAFVIANNWGTVKKTLVDVANYFIDLYNTSTVFRGAVEYLSLIFKQVFTNAKAAFMGIWEVIKAVGKQIFTVFSTVGKVIKGVLTLDMSLIKKSLAEGFTSSLKNGKDMVKGISAEFSTFKSGTLENVKTAIANTFGAKQKLAKITLGKEDTDASGVSDAVEDAVVAGAKKGAGKPIPRPNIEALNVPESNTKSSGTIAAYDIEIAKLKQFRDEVATTASQVKTANDQIAGLEFAKSLKFDPSAVIKSTQTIAEMGARLSAEAGGIQASLNVINTSFVDVSSAIQTSVQNFAASSIETFASFLGNMMSGTASIGDLFKGMLGVVGDFMVNLGKSLIQVAVASAAFKKVLANPVLAIAAGAALILFGTIVKNQLQTGPQAFANGGIVNGSSYYGDKILARVNSGELILNDKQQASVFGMMNSGGGGGGTIIPSVRITGSDLLLVFDRANKDKNRLS